MSQLLKALGATILAMAPVLMKQFIEPPWDIVSIVVYAFVVFLASLRVFRPDERFRLVRNPTLDSAFGQTFAEDFDHESDSEVKAPFRVHVFTPKGAPGRRKLCVAYAYNSHPSHPDHGRTWPKGHGLVWQAFKTGEAQFSMQQDEKWKGCGLSIDEIQATSHVYAVFAIPLRKPAKTESESVSSKVTAILSFDALTPEAADVLSQQYDLFKSNRNSKLLDRAAWVSIFF